MPQAKQFVSHYLREMVFGLEDSVVSTLGAVSGVAVGSGEVPTVIMAGSIIVIVEALSMSAGSYLSAQAATAAFEQRLKQDATRALAEKVTDQESLRDVLRKKKFSKAEQTAMITAIHRERTMWLREIMRGEYRLAATVSEIPLVAGGVMGVFYVAGGTIVLLPYFVLPLQSAFFVALALGVAALATLGWVKSMLTQTSAGRSVAEMVVVSMTAAALGIVVGRFFAIA